MVIGTGELIQHTTFRVITVVVDMQTCAIVAGDEGEGVVGGVEGGDNVVLEIDVADGVTTEGGSGNIDEIKCAQTYRVENHLKI